MINFKCPKCHEPMESPDSLIGEKLNCPRCGEPVEVPVPIDKKELVKNILFKTWYSSPPAFRTGFLTTLGVVAALMISLIIYRNILAPSPTPPSVTTSRIPKYVAPAPPIANVSPPGRKTFSPKTAKKRSVISKPPTRTIKTKFKHSPEALYPILQKLDPLLNQSGLFLVSKQKGQLLEKKLIEYRYCFSKKNEIPYISFWTPDDKRVIGITAEWREAYLKDTVLKIMILPPAFQQEIKDIFAIMTGLDAGNASYVEIKGEERPAWYALKKIGKWTTCISKSQVIISPDNWVYKYYGISSGWK